MKILSEKLDHKKESSIASFYFYKCIQWRIFKYCRAL